MTKFTNKTAITKNNRAGIQPFIDKVRLKGSKFDATSRIDGVSTHTRKFHSNVRGATTTITANKRNIDADGDKAEDFNDHGANHGRLGNKYVTIAHNTSS